MRRAGVDVQVQDCVHPEGEGPPGRPGPGCKVWLRDSRHPPRVWSNVEPGLRTAAERVDGVNTYRVKLVQTAHDESALLAFSGSSLVRSASFIGSTGPDK